MPVWQSVASLIPWPAYSCLQFADKHSTRVSYVAQELDLSGNQIKRAGAMAIGRAIASLPAFKRLLLDENEISSDGIAQLKVRIALWRAIALCGMTLVCVIPATT